MPTARLWAAFLVALLVSGPAQGQQSAGPDMLEAAARGDAGRLKQLVGSGAPIDPVDTSRQTPLLLAVQNNHLAVARLLIEAGANINAQAANMDRPWLLAGARGRTEMIRLMISRGPDYSMRNRYGGTALIPACHYGHVETVRLLLTTEIDVDTINNLGWTCLLEIVILGNGGPAHVEITRLVLGADANPNIADKDGVTPLAHARRRNQHEVAALIANVGGR
jgi:ankyrin repeat protein